MKKQWHIMNQDSNAVNYLQQKLGCDSIFAKMLINRKITSTSQVKAFLNPSLKAISSPYDMYGIQIAVERIYKALTQKEKILIYGDYDVDGVTATAIMMLFLRYAGANVSYYIPHRISDGYDLQANFINNIAMSKKYNLIVTVDCGSKSHSAITTAKKVGIDTIVTDHHTISNQPPKDAVAVINPKLTKCSSNFQYLAGVGVAFYFLLALRKHLRNKDYWYKNQEPNLAHLCDLVALGTVADIVPIVKENRILTHKGLQLLNTNPRIGLETLMQRCGAQKNNIDTETIAFRLAPRLNAAGRMQHAKTACELLLTNNKMTANKLADTLCVLNSKRQTVEKILLEEIMVLLDRDPDILDKNIILIEGKNWFLGVLGIVASRLVKKFNKPVILLSSNRGISKGSARSIKGVNIVKVLKKSNEFLEAFGGHALAAGLTLRSENIPAFKEIISFVISKTKVHSNINPTLVIDAKNSIDNITPRFLSNLEILAPFGNSNEFPMFMDEKIEVISCKEIGKYHHKMKIKSNSTPNKVHDAIRFSIDKDATPQKHFEKIAYRPKWNYWKGVKTPQIIIEDINPDEII